MNKEELDYIPGAGLIANIEYHKQQHIKRQKALGYQFTDDGAFIMNGHNLRLKIKHLREEKLL